MLYLKEVYDTVITNGKTSGAPFLSKPYRFLVQNGCYVSLETQWKSFINPWSQKMEYVSAHRVLQGSYSIFRRFLGEETNLTHTFFFLSQGPNICDVFAPAPPETISKTLLNENDQYHKEILSLLGASLSMPANIIGKELTRKCKGLASYMDLILPDTNKKELKLDLPNDPALAPAVPDLVMLGVISPHHDYCESKSSSETPPTYMQLNFNEKLDRYFNSKPLEIEMTEEPDIVWEKDTATSSKHCCENSGDRNSSENLSSVSNMFMESLTNTTSNTDTATSSGSGQANQQDALTEALINKHNENMEKYMLKQHKVARRFDRDEEKAKKGVDVGVETPVQGVKRSGSHSWKDDPHKSAKHLHLSDSVQNAVGEANGVPAATTTQTTEPQFNQSITPHNHFALWPSFPIGVGNPQSTHAVSGAQYGAPGLLPSLCYIPAMQPNHDQQQRFAQPSYYMMYTPPMFGQHVLYSQPHFVYRSMIPPTTINAANAEASKQSELTVCIPLFLTQSEHSMIRISSITNFICRNGQSLGITCWAQAHPTCIWKTLNHQKLQLIRYVPVWFPNQLILILFFS